LSDRKHIQPVKIPVPIAAKVDKKSEWVSWLTLIQENRQLLIWWW